MAPVGRRSPGRRPPRRRPASGPVDQWPGWGDSRGIGSGDRPEWIPARELGVTAAAPSPPGGTTPWPAARPATRVPAGRPTIATTRSPGCSPPPWRTPRDSASPAPWPIPRAHRVRRGPGDDPSRGTILSGPAGSRGHSSRPGTGCGVGRGTAMIKRARQRQADQTTDAAPAGGLGLDGGEDQGVLAAVRASSPTRPRSTACRRTRSGPWPATRSSTRGASEVRLRPAYKGADEPTRWPNDSAFGPARQAAGLADHARSLWGWITHPVKPRSLFPDTARNPRKPLARPDRARFAGLAGDRDRHPLPQRCRPDWAKGAVRPRGTRLTRVPGGRRIRHSTAAGLRRPFRRG